MRKKPEITIDGSSGFCFGVRKAIERAEQSLETGKKTYCLGKIVHNPAELKRLDEEGLIFIGHDEYSKLKNETVLIRAHGEPPETFEIAKKITSPWSTPPVRLWHVYRPG